MSAELAEVIAGRALLADFRRFTSGAPAAAEWPEWALRLGQHLQALIDAAAQVLSPASAGVQVAQSGSYLAQDGSVWLRADDVGRCARHCSTPPLRALARYDGLRFRLGDDR